MLPKKNRANTREVNRIFKGGKFLNYSILSFKYLSGKAPASSPRISFIVPKAIAKKPVDRNALRRLGYEVLKKYIKQLPADILGVFVLKKHPKNTGLMEDEIKSVISRLSLEARR